MFRVTVAKGWGAFFGVLLFIGGIASAAVGDQVPVPPLQARVTDLTGTLAASQQAQLEQTLSAFEAQKGSQIAVLIVPTTQPETIEQYSIRVATAWRLGRKGVDDGALLLVAKEDRTLRIEVGYGLEGIVPDAVANRITDEVIAPYFKQGDFYGGIQAGIDRLLRVVEGEPLPAPATQTKRGAIDGLMQLIPFIFFGVLIGGGVLRAVLGRFPGALAVGGVTILILWFLLGSLLLAIVVGIVAAIFSLVGGMGRGGGWYSGGGGGMRGGGDFGGRGGGGFGGGGGGFGGGGASGRW